MLGSGLGRGQILMPPFWDLENRGVEASGVMMGRV